MIPLRVSLEGFMSYRDKATLRFDGASLWVLSGPNGVGKSAIFDAITFALYGRHRGGAQNAKDLINHHADTLRVEFDFLMNGNAYSVRRALPSRGQPTRGAFLLLPADADGVEHEEHLADTETERGLEDWVERTIGLEYDTFTSSVVLLQGRSEELLKKRPRERYRVLSKLIDLSLYERLYEAAEQRRRTSKVRCEVLEGQLQGIPVVGDEELTAAQDAMKRTEKEWRKAHQRVEHLAGLVPRAEEWERLEKDLDTWRDELKKTRTLLGREDEIQAGFGRLQRLEEVLPALKSVVEDKGRLSENERSAKEVRQEIGKSQHKLEEAEGKKAAADKEAGRLEKQVEKLQGTDTSYSDRLKELAPLVERLEHLENAQSEVDELKENLATLSPDLEQALNRAVEEEDRLEEIAQALPWLKQLDGARSSLAEARRIEQRARNELKALEPQLREHEEKRKRLVAEAEEAGEEQDRLAQSVARAQERYDEIRKRRAEFEDVSGQPTCELCGQEITQEHAREEMARLNARVDNAKAGLTSEKKRYERSQKRKKSLEAKLAKLDETLSGLSDRRSRLENEHEQAERAVIQHRDQARNFFDNLPGNYQARVAENPPEDARGWMSTTYPTDPELKELKKEMGGKPAHAERLRTMREQFGQKQHWDNLLKSASGRLSKLQDSCSLPEVRRAAEEYGGLQEQQRELRNELAQLKETYRKAKEEAETERQAVESSRERLQMHKAELEGLKASRTEIERSLRAAVKTLPEDWREQADTAGTEELEGWRAERDEIAEYETLYAELERARQSISTLEERIGKLNTRIGEIPEEARHPAKEVEKLLSSANDERENKDNKRREAERHRTELKQRRDRHSELENERREAEREHHLYRLLSNLLGPDGLQLDLVRDAERQLVFLANETLDGLSGGRMRLGLRESNNQRNRALDLIVHDRDTGPHPIAVDLTSGSQRFRIAVSLALAIGRYKGQQARRIESVIIDEGFGSLDKNSRDDMIQVLGDLQQELDRIILVSHQEEFANAFTNGYAVTLEGNTSRVSLLESS